MVLLFFLILRTRPLRVCMCNMAHVVGQAHGRSEGFGFSSAIARHDTRPAGFTHRCRDTVGSSSLTHSRALPSRACRHSNGASRRDGGSFSLCLILQRSNSPTRTPICLSGKLDLTCTFAEDRIFLALCGAVFSRCHLLVSDRSGPVTKSCSRGLRSGRLVQFDNASCYRVSFKRTRSRC